MRSACDQSRKVLGDLLKIFFARPSYLSVVILCDGMSPTSHELRGVFQKYAERFHRMLAIASRLMIFHVKLAWYM